MTKQASRASVPVVIVPITKATAIAKTRIVLLIIEGMDHLDLI